MMRHLTILGLFLLSIIPSLAGTNKVLIIWDAPITYIDSSPLYVQDIVGYTIYQRLWGSSTSSTTFVTNQNLSTNINYLLTTVDKGTWMFTLTTWVNGRTSLLESAKAPEKKLKVPEAKASVLKIQSVTEANQ